MTHRWRRRRDGPSAGRSKPARVARRGDGTRSAMGAEQALALGAGALLLLAGAALALAWIGPRRCTRCPSASSSTASACSTASTSASMDPALKLLLAALFAVRAAGCADRRAGGPAAGPARPCWWRRWPSSACRCWWPALLLAAAAVAAVADPVAAVASCAGRRPVRRMNTETPPLAARAVLADDERLMREQLRARLAEVWPDAADRRRGAQRPRGGATWSPQHRPDVVFLDIRMPGLTGVEAAREIAQMDARRRRDAARDRLHHRLRPVRRRGLRAGRGRLRAQARRARAAAAAPSSASASAWRARGTPDEAAAPPLQQLLHQLGAQLNPGARAAVPAVDPGQRRQHDPDDPGRRGAVLHQRREVHPGADGAGRGADPQADQGARRRARPGAVLADPPQHAGQREGDRRRHARLPRPPDRAASRATPRSSRSAAATPGCSRACSRAPPPGAFRRRSRRRRRRA